MNELQIPVPREIVSIPAANTYDLVIRHGVYSCPVTYPVRSSLYATFRRAGGAMDRLFLVKRLVECRCIVEAVEADASLPDADKHQILGYLKDPDARHRLDELNSANPRFGASVRFYVLDRDRIVWLPYEAHMESPSVAWTYYSLRELLDPASAPSARPQDRDDIQNS